MGKPGTAVRPLQVLREAIRKEGTVTAGMVPSREAARRILVIFDSAHDPRQSGKVRHRQGEVIPLAFCAIVCDCDTWMEIEDFGRDRLGWPGTLSPFEAGAPSHDTIARVMGNVDADELQALLVGFVRECLDEARESLGLERPRAHYAIDGKEERGTGRRYLHSVGGKLRNLQNLHVWDATSLICMYTRAIDRKTNEIPVAQAWLSDEANDIAGAIITADALHTQKRTAEIIVSREADYVLGLKGNQGSIHEAAKDYFDDVSFLARIRREGTDYLKVTGKEGGKVVVRETWRVDPVEGEFPEWAGLRSMVCQRKTWTEAAQGSEPRTETRYHVASLTDVREIAGAIRAHWACETGHWMLDVAFKQDRITDTDRNRFENRVALNKLALALTRLMQTVPGYDRMSLERIRKSIARDPEGRFGDLLAVATGDAFVEAVEGMAPTEADLRRYERVLREAGEEVL